MKTQFIILSLIYFFCIANLKAQQDGSLDLNFNKPIYINPPPQNGFIDGYVASSIMLSTGKLLVYGHLENYMNTPIHNLALLNTNGIIDSSFNAGTGPDPVFFDYGPHPEMICEQPDGKIIIVGSFTSFNGSSQNRIVRIHPNGSIDSTFKIGSGADNRVFCVKLQADGKILVGGIFTVFNDLPASNLVRLNPNGSVDTSFNIGKGFEYKISSGTQQSSCITAIELQEDKILVGGFFNRFIGLVKNTMVRLNANGSLDNALTISENMSGGTLQKIVYHPGTNRIYIGGYISDFSGVVTTKVLRLYPDGSTDTTYNSPGLTGFEALSEINDFVLLPDGKLLVAGLFAISGCNDLARFNPDGTCDTTFHFTTFLYSNKVNSIVPSGTGEIYASGDFSWVNNESISKGSIVKLLNNGETDLSFNPVFGIAGGFSSTSSVLNGDTILIYNTADYYNERLTNGFVKIKADGSIAYTNPRFEHISAFDQLSGSMDGKFLCTWIHTYKLNPDLSWDSTFLDRTGISTQWISPLSGHAEQKDGKIIITGDFQYIPPYSNSRQCIQRINADGSPDDTFKVGSGIAYKSSEGIGTRYYLNTVQFLDDGRILAGGYFNDFRGNDVSNIVSINPDGTFDHTMKFGTSFNDEVIKILIQDDSKIMVCGLFTEFSGMGSNYIVRLNHDGSFDSSFTSPFGITGEVSRITKIIIQADGKYIIAGTIDNATKLMRLNQDGTIDDSFDNTHDFDFGPIPNYIYFQDRIHNISILSNGKILVQGYFEQIDTVERRGIALLNNTVITSVNKIKINNNITVYPNPVSDVLYITSASKPDKLAIFDLNGRMLISKTIETNWINITNLSKGVYVLKVYTSGKMQCLKVIRK